MKINNIINFIAFQIIWLIAVLGAANELLWPTIIAVFAFMLWQLSPQRRHPNDIRFVIYAITFGLILDSLWQASGLIEFKLALPFIAPIWILLLWITFALTFNHSLTWLKKSPWFPIVFGMIGAPLSYYAGTRLEAVSYPGGALLISVFLSTSWAVVTFFFARYDTLFKHSKKTGTINNEY